MQYRNPTKPPVAAVLALAMTVFGSSLFAANHREAPITALDHKADITDVYAFVSYDEDTQTGETPSHVTMIMSVDPLLEPGNGPTLFPFDDDIVYTLNIDNNHDANADIRIEFRFDTSYRLPDIYTAVAGIGDEGAFDPVNGLLIVPPQIRTLEDIGLNQIQTYTVAFRTLDEDLEITNPNGSPFFAVPGNAGPRTMDYEALYNEGTYSGSNGINVFAGTTDDAFWIDLGAAFDTANFRTLGSGVPGILTAEEDAAQTNFASDTVSGYAVNSIAIEVPIEMLTSTGQVEDPSAPESTIGIWASTSRPRVTIRNTPDPPIATGPLRQVQRMGNPLINELLIGIGSKDRFSMSIPAKDDQFDLFFLFPPIVEIVEALYGGALVVPPIPRFDLLPLVNYLPPIAPEGTPQGPLADLLRLNTGVPATPVANASRLGLLAADAAGFPNGRRVFDDVVDITLRVAVGGVLDPTFPGYTPGVNDMLGDGVNVNDTPYQPRFPYLGLAPDGRNRRHIDPGEEGGGPLD